MKLVIALIGALIGALTGIFFCTDVSANQTINMKPGSEIIVEAESITTITCGYGKDVDKVKYCKCQSVDGVYALILTFSFGNELKTDELSRHVRFEYCIESMKTSAVCQ